MDISKLTIAEVEATQTLVYTTESYLEYCELEGVDPTDDGFLKFIKKDIDEDFGGYEGCLLIKHKLQPKPVNEP